MNWTGTRAFVTGHTGFKGTWLCASLLARGAHVSGYALPPDHTPNMHELTGIANDVAGVHGDVRDAERLARELAAARPDVVFHLAAQPLVRRSLIDPIGTYATNVMGTVHLLHAVRQTPSVRAVVVVTSDKCYENDGRPEPYRESDPMGGHDPYSSSKGAAELITSAYRRTYFTGGPPVASARAGNVIGGGDWSEDRLIPDLVRALVADRDPRLRFPGATRPWQHVLDAINGYQVLASRLIDDGPQFARAWNFGPQAATGCTVVDLARRFLAAWNTSHQCIVESEVAPHEAAALLLDSADARRLLDWSPALDLDETVAETAYWYRTWHAGGSVRDITFKQIATFGPNVGTHDSPRAAPYAI